MPNEVVPSEVDKLKTDPELKPLLNRESDTPLRRITQTILSNTIVLGCDYLATSMPFGMALKAEALVKKPTWRDLLELNEWKGAYKRTWGFLKYGFYPTFILEAGVSEATKQWGSPMLAHYSGLIMPGIISAGTAPAASLVAINARYKLQLDLYQLYRQKGLSGVTRLTGGPTSIGIREGLCFYALHHNTTPLAKQIADKSLSYSATSFLFRNREGHPTVLTKLIASTPDGLAMLAAQPLTIFAANAAICKYDIQQKNHVFAPKPSITSPLALLRWQLDFSQFVCRSIVEEGKKSGLSPLKSFAPGMVTRTTSLLGTLTVFKYCLTPVTNAVGEYITHRKYNNL